jgi:hypothetical protein
VPLEEGRLWLQHGDFARESVDDAGREPVQAVGVVGQAPLTEQTRMGIDPDAERPTRPECCV